MYYDENGNVDHSDEFEGAFEFDYELNGYSVSLWGLAIGNLNKCLKDLAECSEEGGNVPIICTKKRYEKVSKACKNSKVIPAEEAIEFMHSNNVEGVIIDDMRGVLESILGCRVCAGSLDTGMRKEGDSDYIEDDKSFLTIHTKDLKYGTGI